MGLLIPKTVHRIWFGPETMPAEYERYAESWERRGYEVRLWTEANLPELRNQEIYDDPGIGGEGGGQPLAIRKWVQRADLVSYELIWRYGGIYANTDMECLRSLDPILEDVRAFAGVEQEHFLGTALMGCVAGDPFFDAVIDMLPHRYRAMPGRNMEAVTGPHLLTTARDEFPDAITQFPSSYFYPFLYSEMNREHDEHPDAYASHHWGHMR